jgi:hypothetical protein
MRHNPRKEPKHHSPAHGWLRPEAVLGLIALAVQPWLLTLRAGELAHALTLTVADRPFGKLILFGTPYEIGTCGVMGLALTLAQMIGVSVFIMETSSGVRARYLKFLSGSGWIIATSLELALSVICANGVAERSIGFVLALLLTIFETCSGILVVDCLFIPVALGLGGAVRRAFRTRK